MPNNGIVSLPQIGNMKISSEPATPPPPHPQVPGVFCLPRPKPEQKNYLYIYIKLGLARFILS